jgi:hypothetical protein
MIKADWLSCGNPAPMLAALEQRASDRKLRLFASACCRRIDLLLVDRRSREALDVAERFADGRATFGELVEASYAADLAADLAFSTAYGAAQDEALAAGLADDWIHAAFHRAADASAAAKAAACAVALDAADCVRAGELACQALAQAAVPLLFGGEGRPYLREREALETAERVAQAALLRDILGNPSSPHPIDPTWLTPAVSDLARSIDAGLAFDRMPALADALEQAGCTDETILDHCRSGTDHVRGCWVVDGLLGKP